MKGIAHVKHTAPVIDLWYDTLSPMGFVVASVPRVLRTSPGRNSC